MSKKTIGVLAIVVALLGFYFFLRSRTALADSPDTGHPNSKGGRVMVEGLSDLADRLRHNWKSNMSRGGKGTTVFERDANNDDVQDWGLGKIPVML